MPHEIVEWNAIAQDYKGGTLLIGNGTSMAVDTRFGYVSLIDYAKNKNHYG